MKPLTLERSTLQTPLGELCVLESKHGVISICWSDRIDSTRLHLKKHIETWTEQAVSFSPAVSALKHYFEGEPYALQTLPINLIGTAFQKKVWQTLQRIQPGETWSYKALAIAIGRPTAYRAVANANGKNPLPIRIPCHRVIASDGGIGGFSSGIHRKQWLLNHERGP